MTYQSGGQIQASDYNTFATLAGGINEIYADLYPGATTLPNAAFGYGQNPALAGVATSGDIQATQWASLFQVMRDCGAHQGTTVVPPLPGSNPSSGDTIAAYNTPPGAISALMVTLRNNRFNVAPAQSTLIPGTVYPSSSSWTTLLQYTYQINFSTWNNARYFFNAGGFLGVNGSYPSASTPVEIAWKDAIDRMSTLRFTWNGTTPGSGSGGTSIGFYNLTTSYQTIYQKSLGAGYYTTSYILVEAKLNAAAGTNGIVDFRINLVDGDLTPDLKTGAISFWTDNTKAAGVILYPGPAVSISAGSFTYS